MSDLNLRWERAVRRCRACAAHRSDGYIGYIGCRARRKVDLGDFWPLWGPKLTSIYSRPVTAIMRGPSRATSDGDGQVVGAQVVRAQEQQGETDHDAGDHGETEQHAELSVR